MDYGYVRVSSQEQNPDRQLDSLRALGVPKENIFSDKQSGRDTNRDGLKKCISSLKKGDTLIVHELSRLGRSLIDLCRIVEKLNDAGISVKFIKENLTFNGFEKENDALSTLQLHMFGSICEYERQLIKLRQKEGIEAAKRRGKYKGRKPKLTEEQVAALKVYLNKKEQGERINLSQVCKEFDISRATLYFYKKKIEID